MAIIIGSFFLYALFLFVASPIIIASSIVIKERRISLYQQLVFLILQGAVVMLIIELSAILMKNVQETTFFANSESGSF